MAQIPDAREEPQPPTLAYRLVEAQLHPSYFITPPPPEGVILTVRCQDRSKSRWEVSKETCARIISQIRDDDRILEIEYASYDTPPRAL